MSDKTKFTPEFIQQQLELAKKAIPIPWVDPWKQPVGHEPGIYSKSGIEVLGVEYYDGPNIAITREDTAYLISSANNYPAALDEILRLRRALVAVIVLTCREDNQPHQYVGDPNGLMKAAMDGDMVGDEVIEFMKGKAEK